MEQNENTDRLAEVAQQRRCAMDALWNDIAAHISSASVPDVLIEPKGLKRSIAAAMRRLNPFAKWNEAQHRRTAELLESLRQLIGLQEQQIATLEQQGHQMQVRFASQEIWLTNSDVRLNQAEEKSRIQADEILQSTNRLCTLQRCYEQTQVMLAELPAILDLRMNLIEKMQTQHSSDVAPLRLELTSLAQRLATLTDTVYNRLHNSAPASCKPTPVADILAGEFNFLKWEKFTRGSEEGIAAQQLDYAENFRGVTCPVLDAGCGRGEFLEILRAANINAYGIDSDAYMVQHCTAKGLRVELGELFPHISALPDNSLGGLFLGHVVEHLPTEALLALIPLAYRKIAGGGTLIMETPNPMCLTTFSGAFYSDPTHIKPLHPKALEFLCNAAGFINANCLLSAPVSDENKLKPIAESEPIPPVMKELLLQINANIAHLNEVIFSFGNYAMIATKPRD